MTNTTKPCGGCGATESSKRCIGCMHDFGDAESEWVRKGAAYIAEVPGGPREKFEAFFFGKGISDIGTKLDWWAVWQAAIASRKLTNAEIEERGMKAALDIFGRYDTCHWRFAHALLATDPMAITRTAQPSEAQTFVYDTSVVKRIATQMGWTPPGEQRAELTDDVLMRAIADTAARGHIWASRALSDFRALSQSTGE